jgi:predicted permease
MNFAPRFRSWWKAASHRAELRDQIQAELQSHIENFADDLERSGLSREDALRRAKAQLGSTAAQQDECYESLGLRLWDDLRADVRYTVRQLLQAPAFTITVLVVLALGIGANAAMFSVLDVTLLRWLPYSRPGQLMALGAKDGHGADSMLFYADITEMQPQAHTVSSIAYYEPGGESQIQSGNETQAVAVERISANLFLTLGIEPSIGRSFSIDDQQPGKNDVIILSESAWQAVLHRDPEPLGKTVKLDDRPYTVVGVMPDRFLFPADERRTQVWLPLEITAAKKQRDFSACCLSVIARTTPRTTPAAVSTELSAIQKRLAKSWAGNISGDLAPSQVIAIPYRETLTKDTRPALLALLTAVALIWLIACANVANLMLARSTARQRELAVRGALGARRGRIVRQLFTESLLLSLLGAAAGLGLAQLALRAFDKVLANKLNLPGHLSPNWMVLGALLLLSVLSAVLFGLLPAWLSSSAPIESTLRQSSAQTAGNLRAHRLQRLMVIAEIGLSLVLLVGCGLLLRTIFELRHVPLGFRTDHVLMIEPKLPRNKYRGIDVNRAVYQPMLERVKQINGVRAAALSTVLPLRNRFSVQMTIYVNRSVDGKSANGTRIDGQLRAAGPELQQILGFKMYEGRYFDASDTPDSQPVAVVNRAFARLYNDNVIGKFSLSMGKGRNVKVVGVMDDFHQAAVNKPSAPEIDLCASQLRPTDGFYQPTMLAHVELAVRTDRDPQTMIGDIRRALAAVNPDLQSSAFETMDQVVEDSIGSQLLTAHLLELFSGSALLVALAGLYGLLSYLVIQRTHELGVRVALGAQPGRITGMILRQAAMLIAIGSALGIGLSLFSTRLLANTLFGVKPNNPGNIAGACAFLALCGIVAAYLPARRASRVDPMEALRAE